MGPSSSVWVNTMVSCVASQVAVSGPQQFAPLDRTAGSASQTQGTGQLLQPAAGALPPELRQRCSLTAACCSFCTLRFSGSVLLYSCFVGVSVWDQSVRLDPLTSLPVNANITAVLSLRFFLPSLTLSHWCSPAGGETGSSLPECDNVSRSPCDTLWSSMQWGSRMDNNPGFWTCPSWQK